MMNKRELIPDAGKGGMFNEETVWFLTCVCATIFPIILTYLWHSLEQRTFADLKDILKDSAIAVLSISISILALALDRSRMIEEKCRKRLTIVGSIFALLSYTENFLVMGIFMKKSSQHYYEDIQMGVLCLMVIICTVMGWKTYRMHNKAYKKFRQSINSRYALLVGKYNSYRAAYNTSQKKE